MHNLTKTTVAPHNVCSDSFQKLYAVEKSESVTPLKLEVERLTAKMVAGLLTAKQCRLIVRSKFGIEL